MRHECSLCGYAFEESEMAASGCAACRSSPAGCGLVKCPACGCEWPPESSSRAVGFLKKLFGKTEGAGR